MHVLALVRSYGFVWPFFDSNPSGSTFNDDENLWSLLNLKLVLKQRTTVVTLCFLQRWTNEPNGRKGQDGQSNSHRVTLHNPPSTSSYSTYTSLSVRACCACSQSHTRLRYDADLWGKFGIWSPPNIPTELVFSRYWCIALLHIPLPCMLSFILQLLRCPIHVWTSRGVGNMELGWPAILDTPMEHGPTSFFWAVMHGMVWLACWESFLVLFSEGLAPGRRGIGG